MKGQRVIGDQSNNAKASLFERNEDAVAIVGYAFRFPGDISDGDAFWEALSQGQDLVTRIPEDRWPVEELEHPKRDEPGRAVTFSAGVLSRIDEFDAGFFGISPREASWLDPQQRLLLELSWEAMENGGRQPSSLAGSDCAVYVGISGLDYGTRGLGDLSSFSPHLMTGNTLSIAANRLSYVFDLRGPSLAVDTACSSSLVALHHACNSLRSGEASMAIAGGVNLLLNPYPFVGFTKASMLSAEGRCKAFDASGDGYVRSEGGAVVLLKPLAAALADGDNIEGVILASGVNADGARKTGITIPSAEGQSDLMRQVLKRSGLKSGDVDFIEAHGTGTAVGDPIETAAIGEVYGEGRKAPLPIGSVKANLGHLEPASGMAGLVKTLLALKHRTLPPGLHVKQPNPYIDFEQLNLALVDKIQALPHDDGMPLVAGINSFGFGGANAHVLLAEPPPSEPEEAADSAPPMVPLILSAKSESALRMHASQYADLVSGVSVEAFYNIAYSALQHREYLEKRLVIEEGSPAEVETALRQYASGDLGPAVFEAALPENGDVAFIYSGNGSQWLGMGRTLLQESPLFAESIAEIDEAVEALAGFSLLDELRADEAESRLDSTEVAQPLLFAIQVGVTRLLREMGCEPKFVAGHSVGEVAAAWAAGALDLEQAVRLICARSEAQALTRGSGRMAAVGLSEQAIQDLLGQFEEPLDIEIAGINSPNNVTIAGSLEALRLVEQALQQQGAFCYLLDLDYAFHSRHMDAIEATLIDSLRGLEPSVATSATFVSTVTGDLLDGASLGAEYWWRNVREPVKFATATQTMLSLGCRVFVEIGPHAILQRYLEESAKSAENTARVLPTLRRDDDAAHRVKEAALKVVLSGDRRGLAKYFPHPGQRVKLPNYPWQKERHWHPVTNESMGLLERRRVHPLLGWLLPEASMGWENVLDPDVLPWLGDHRVGGAIVFPGAAYAEMGLAAAREWLGEQLLAVEELDIVAPMVFDAQHARTLRFKLNERDGSFQIVSRQRLSEDDWTLHAVGRILETTGRLPESRIQLDVSDTYPYSAESHYALAKDLGLDYGTEFQRLGEISLGEKTLRGAITSASDESGRAKYLLEPAVLDACFQSLVDLYADDVHKGHGAALLPVKLGRMNLLRNNPVAYFKCEVRRASRRSLLADFELFDDEERLVARVGGCRFRAAPMVSAVQDTVEQWQTIGLLEPHVADGLTAAVPDQKIVSEMFRSGVLGQKARERWFKETLPLFEALSLSFIYEAFRIAESREPGLLQRLVCSDRPQIRWMCNLLQKEGLLTFSGESASLAQEAGLPEAQEIWQTLLADSPESLPHLTLLGRVGRHLPGLLTNEVDIEVLRESLRLSPISEMLYESDPEYVGIRDAIVNALQSLAKDWPRSRRLRILELTPGVSEMAKEVTGHLPPDRLDYVIGVPDEMLLQRQQAVCQDFQNVRVVRVDRSDWHLAEAISPERYDVVILRHVLHAAKKPHALLNQARRWLAADGLLMIAESYPDWSSDLVGGIDPEWWHTVSSDDPTGETVSVSSLHSPGAWKQVVEEEGFEDVESYSEASSEGLKEGAYLLFARRPVEDVDNLSANKPAKWMLVVEEFSSVLADQLRVQLESQGQDVILVTDTDLSSDPNIDHVVVMLGWDKEAELVSVPLSQALNIAQQLQELPNNPDLWFVTRGGALVTGIPEERRVAPVQSALWGFARVFMNEHPEIRCRLVDLTSPSESDDVARRLSNELLWPDDSDEVILASDARYVPSFRRASGPTKTVSERHSRFRLDFKVPGQLRNLLWMSQSPADLGENQVEVESMAAGLNFRDVMYLMGLLPDEAVEKGFAGASLGLEFSGVVSRVGSAVHEFEPGDRVMGFGSSCFSSHVVTRSDALAHLPDQWGFEAAATVPTVFFTAYYALKHLANVQPGERVLIHGAAGGVGIAAIQLARHLGAEIFATAGSDEKRDFVRLLGADHVLDSRSLAFADDIQKITGGEGVDVVLNSLAGEAIRRNLSVLKPFGRFLELGKRDFFENTPVGLRPFKDNISYFGIDADQLLIARPEFAGRMFRQLMSLFREGALAPLPYRAFAAENVVEAFRYMQQARHIGKVVVSLNNAKPSIQPEKPLKREMSLDGESTWLITGGLSGFGLQSAKWLASRGVRHLVLIGRRGVNTPGAAEALDLLNEQGVNVRALACDITNVRALAGTIKQVRDEMPSLRGVLHAAMVIDDRLMTNLDAASMDAVLRPKLIGAWNLHQQTLDVPLEHFILYSSITTSIGNPGQGNYVAANAGLEGLVELRREMGLPALCVGWGPISDAGYLTRNTSVRDSLEQRLGRPPLGAEQALGQLDEVLSRDAGVTSIANFDWNVLSRLLPSSEGTRFAWLNTFLRDNEQDEQIDFKTLIAGKSEDEVLELVTNLVIREIARTLCVDAGSIDVHRSLHDMGMDSLMAVELAVGLEQRLGIQLPVMMLSDSPSVARVSARIVEKLLRAEGDDGPESERDIVLQGMIRQHGEDDVWKDQVEGLSDEVAELAQKGTSLIQ